MASVHAVSAADLQLLRQFDTPTVCNVVELFDRRLRHFGYMDARIRACFPALPPMVGYAATATFRSAATPAAGNVYSGLAEQVASFAEVPGPAVVVFQDIDSPVASATFGEVMCTTYKAFGAAGLITSGAGATWIKFGPEFPLLCRRRHLRPRLFPHPAHQRARSCRRRHGGAGRPHPRRLQRRDHHSQRHRRGGRSRLLRIHGRRGGRARLPESGTDRSQGLRGRAAGVWSSASRRWRGASKAESFG